MGTCRHTCCMTIAAIVWLIIVGGGLAALARYSGTPLPSSAVFAHWPADSHVPRSERQPALIMFAHPQCPCSRASLGELARLMVRVQGRVAPIVLFYRPADAEFGWERTDLWDSAAMIPGVQVATDVEGIEAERFGVAVSGHVLLYDTRGRLVFSGGITPARGHAGDNAGSAAIASLLNTGHLQTARTPTFGCYLRHSTTTDESS